MTIVFLGDTGHPNARSWINALEVRHGFNVYTWALPLPHSTGRRLARMTLLVLAIPHLRRWMKKLKPDIVIAYRITSYGFLGAATGFHPLVVAAQGETDVWPPDSMLAPLKAAMARYALARADFVHAWGEHMTVSLLDLGADPQKIMVLPRGIDVEAFHPPAEEPADHALRLITTRGLFPDYRQEDIIRAVGCLVQKGIPVTFDIAGAGPDRERLKALVVSQNLGTYVRFHGHVANEVLPDLLRTANVYVSMPISEGVSASLLEAMACGCFPVVSDLPANRSWIRSGENGYLVPCGDWQKLADVLERVWSAPEKLEEVRCHNRALVEEKGSIAKNMASFVDAYYKLVHGRAT